MTDKFLLVDLEKVPVSARPVDADPDWLEFCELAYVYRGKIVGRSKRKPRAKVCVRGRRMLGAC